MSDPAIGNTWDAAAYDDKQNFVWKFGSNLIELLAPQPGEKILDLGSGTGHLAAQIAELGAHVVGLDASSAMVAQAKVTYPTLAFHHVDARTVLNRQEIQPDTTAADRLADAEYDAIFSNATLHWIAEADTVIRGVARIAKPGARFVAELGGKGNVAKVHGAIAEARRNLGYPATHSVLFFPSLSEYASLLEQHGFEVTFMQLFDRPTPLQGEDGLADWAATFAHNEIDDIPSGELPRFFAELQKIARTGLHDGTQWVADYRRLRFVAYRNR